MPPVGFETTIPASERPQTQVLERAATGTGNGALLEDRNTVDSDTEYFVARQQYKGNMFLDLYLHGNTKRFYIIDSHTCVNSNKRGRNCCVPVAKLVMRKRRNVTLYVHCYIATLLIFFDVKSNVVIRLYGKLLLGMVVVF